LNAYNREFFNDPAISAFRLFGVADNNQAWAQSADIFGDYLIGCPNRATAAGYIKARVPTWKLFFNAGIKLHGAVDVFAFAPRGLTGNNNIEAAIKNWYISFFVNLDPNKRVSGVQPITIGGSIPTWTSYSTPANANTMYVTDTTFASRADPDASAKCQFFSDNRARVLN
jgi:hypothetical protein